MRERRAYVVLAAVSVVLSAMCILFCISFVRSNNHKWCDVVSTIIITPVPKPADPKTHPSREKSYEFYQKFVRLDRSLGCG